MPSAERTQILAVFMEPASYKVRLVEELRTVWNGSLDVLYIGNNLSQDWGFNPKNSSNRFLPKSSLDAVREVWRLLRTGRYDLLHLAGWGHPVLASSLLTAATMKIPVVLDTDTPLPVGATNWKSMVKSALYPTLFKFPKVFLPAGNRQAEYLRHYGVEDMRIRIGKMTSDVSGIGAYSARFTPEKKSAALRKYNVKEEVGTRFLYLGRLEPHKGIVDLLEAFQRLAAGRGDVTLLVAGSGSLMKLVQNAQSANSRIHYLGHLKDDLVWEAYNLADVFVLPSHFEPWGLVVNEAMAAGLPVIVSDRVGSIDDLVRDDVTGLIVPAEAIAALVGAMDRMAKDVAVRQQMGEDARRLIGSWTLQSQASIMAHAWVSALS
ncbi:MAG: glycosyltransferase family 4 protein [Proteobacteria bacterium]|nr:glycosyltransferase family 4 protein [Pseudomonadota bacterium]